MHLELNYLSDIDEGKKIHFPFSFIVRLSIVARDFVKNSVTVGAGFAWRILNFTITEKFATGFQNWYENDCNDFVVFSEHASFRCRHIPMDWNQQELLKFASLLTTWIVFLTITVEGILVCSLHMPLFFSNRIFSYRLMRFINAIQLYFQCLSVYYLVLLATSDEVFVWIPLRTNYSDIKVFCKVNCPPMVDSVYRSKSFLINILGAYQYSCSFVALLLPEMWF